MIYKGIFTSPTQETKELSVESETFLRACLLLLDLATEEGVEHPLEHIVDEDGRWARSIDFIGVKF